MNKYKPTKAVANIGIANSGAGRKYNERQKKSRLPFRQDCYGKNK